MIALGAELAAQQALRTAGKQEATQRLHELLAEGRELAIFLRTGVKQHYGNRSEKLAEFDLQPFRGRKSQARAHGAINARPQCQHRSCLNPTSFYALGSRLKPSVDDFEN